MAPALAGGGGSQFRLAGTRATISGKGKGPERDLAPGPGLVGRVVTLDSPGRGGKSKQKERTWSAFGSRPCLVAKVDSLDCQI